MLNTIALVVMWVLALAITLGFGAAALTAAFYAGAAWKRPAEEEPERWKWRLGGSIGIQIGVLLILRYETFAAGLVALSAIAACGIVVLLWWKARHPDAERDGQ